MRKLGLVIVAALVLTYGCRGQDSEKAAGDAKGASGRIRLLGSSTVTPLAGPLGEAFGKNHAVQFEMEESNSNWGIGALRSGMTDIALSIKPPSSGEEDKNLVAHPIARDGLCMIVNKDNPVDALSDDQLRDIFQGKVTNWKEVGGKDAPLVRLNHAEVRTSLVMFVKYLGLQVSDMKYTDVVIGSDKEAIQGVVNKPDAITYVSIASALTAQAAGSPIKLIGLKGVAPTVANVENGTVPVVYDVSFTTQSAPNPQTKAFVEFATSAPAAEVRKQKNFAAPKS
ncbi:MAG: substrate-binding domain-containing protein [Candidatus Binatia bacterium]|jgi:phosphate transport system substrate-binding protein